MPCVTAAMGPTAVRPLLAVCRRLQTLVRLPREADLAIGSFKNGIKQLALKLGEGCVAALARSREVDDQIEGDLPFVQHYDPIGQHHGLKLGHRIQTVQMSAAASAETETITEAQIAASTIRSRMRRLSDR